MSKKLRALTPQEKLDVLSEDVWGNEEIQKFFRCGKTKAIRKRNEILKAYPQAKVRFSPSKIYSDYALRYENASLTRLGEIEVQKAILVTQGETPTEEAGQNAGR